MNCKITINEHENHFMVRYISYFCIGIQIKIITLKSNMALTKRFFLNVSISFFILFISCNGKNKGANNYLNDANIAYTNGNYALAKLKIDSIKILYPTAFKEIDEAFELL